MPEMNGYDVCGQLKSNSRMAEVPVIFLSALNAIEHKVKGFRLWRSRLHFEALPASEEVQAREWKSISSCGVRSGLSATPAGENPGRRGGELCGRWSSSPCPRWRCVRARFAILCCGSPGVWRSGIHGNTNWQPRCAWWVASPYPTKVFRKKPTAARSFPRMKTGCFGPIPQRRAPSFGNSGGWKWWPK